MPLTSPLRKPRALVSLAIAIGAIPFVATACGGGNAASTMVKSPEYAPENQSKCAVRASQSEPLIVEWPPAERGRLEASVRRGVIAVRYVGCEMKLVPQCRVRESEYKYAPVTRKSDSVRIKNEDDLYAALPTGAIRFEAKLKTAGQLNVQMTMVGRYESSRAIERADLEGDCDSVTHVVTALTVGAFSFFAGGDAQVGGGVSGLGAGAGGSSGSSREMLTQDGDDAACGRATRSDTAPPDGCGALIRLEVAEIAPSRKSRVIVAPRPTDTATDDEPVAPRYVRPRPTSTPTSTSAPTPTSTSTPNDGDKGTVGKVVIWTALGSFGAAAVLGTIALTTAKSATDSTSSTANCDKDHSYCNADGLAAKDRAHAFALSADGFLLLGLTTAVIYYFLPSKTATTVGIAPTPGGGAAVGVGGRF